MATYTDTYTGAYLDTYGDPVPAVFPQAPLDAEVDLQLTADSAWTSITDYVYQRDGTSPPIRIQRGRPDESSTATPSSCSMQWNNRGGQFSPKNPLGTYYGQLNRNTPVRVSVPDQVTYLRFEDDTTSSCSTPDSSGLGITGTLDILIDCRLSNWQESQLCSKWGDTGQSWQFQLNGDGTVQFAWWTGSNEYYITSTQPVPGPGRMMIRCLFDPSAGSVTYYTAPDMDGTQTQLGQVVLFDATTLSAGTGQPVTIGANTADGGPQGIQGQVYELQVWDGNSASGGTLEADPQFADATAGNTTYADAQGNTWTVSGTAEYSDRSYRYHGECASLPQQWDPTGTDIWTPVQASGILRRLQQANAPILSAMKRAVQAMTGDYVPVAYWPCEDLTNATQIAPGFTGGLPMTFTGAPTLGEDSTFLCSNPLPEIETSAWYGTVPAGLSWTSNVLRFLLYEEAGTLTNGWVIAAMYTTGTVRLVELIYGAGGALALNGWSASGTLLFETGAVAFAIDGLPMWIGISLTPDGSGVIQYQTEKYTIGQDEGYVYSGTVDGTIGEVTHIVINPNTEAFGSAVAGHITVQAAYESIYDIEDNTAADGSLTGPLAAWAGETAGNRFARLCTENGIAPRVYGFPDTTTAMGAQQVDTLSNVLQSCEDADHGQIYEPRQALGLGYRTLQALCGQGTAGLIQVDYAAAETGDGQNPIGVTDDDQYTVNDWTITNNQGSSYQLQLNDGSAMSISPPPAGAGDYASSKTLYLYSDGQLPDAASWMLHVSVCDDYRYPAVPFHLARPELADLFYALQDLEIGDLVTITSPPQFLTYDTIRQLLCGVTEGIGGYWWTMSWQCVPASPYDVLIAGDPVLGRANTSGSTLAEDAASGATSLSVATTGDYAVWTQAESDFPFDILIAGERITVTDITGSTSPQTFTVTRSVNSVVKSQDAGAAVTLFYPPVAALT
jgi:hypothetical protein